MNVQFKVRDLRQKKWFVVDDEYLNGYAKLCGWQATLVYLSLCRHASKEQKSFPSTKLMAKELGVSRDTINEGIKALKKWNVIKVKNTYRKDGGKSANIYTLIDKSEWKPKPTPHVGESDIPHDAVADMPHVGDNGIPYRPQPLTHVGHTDNKDTHRRRHSLRIGLSSQTKRKNVSFKEEDYKLVIDEYQTLKGITLQGKEFLPIRQAIKTMFLSGRTSDQIIAAIQWVSQQDYSDWTIRTVQMKLPEILPKLGIVKDTTPQSPEDQELLRKTLAKEGGSGQ